MKFGFRTGGFAGWKVESVLEELKKIGFDGAELCLEPADMRPEQFTQKRAKELRNFMDQLGIEVTSVSYHADFESMDQRLINTFKAVEITDWLGANILIINSERVEQDKKNEQWNSLRDRLTKLTAHAKEYDVYIAIEPEPLQIIDNTNDMIRIIKEVESLNLRVNLDIGHAYITDPSLIDSIEMLGDAIVHAHIEDIKDKVHNHLEIGQGDIDFAKMHSAFMDIGYNGFYVVDLFRLGDDPSGVATRTISALQKTFI
ncbi:MAG: sugar phosphate isomerase/epimerase family protein [Candidatus Poribacteria bacterium]